MRPTDVTDDLLTMVELIARLTAPLGAEELAHGWTSISQAAMLKFFRELRDKIMSEEKLPYLGIVRGLDFWGITGGELLQQAALVDELLRSGVEN